MVTNEVADTSPDVPAAKRAKILSEDEGNEGGHEIAERVGGEIGAVQPWLAVSNEAGSNGRSGANAPGAASPSSSGMYCDMMALISWFMYDRRRHRYTR